MDKISVIIPAYNAEATIQRACDSVLCQEGPQVELVVVNDGSGDGTAAILDAYAREDDRVVVIHQENGGVCRARNAGLDGASGSHILFLDADDELLPGALQTLLNLMQEHRCDIVAGISERVRPDGTSYPREMPIEGDFEVWKGEQAFRKSLEDHPATYSVWGKLYRREVLENIRFVEGKKLHEDSFFLFEVLRQGLSMVVTRTMVLRYHITAGSASRSMFSEKFLDMLYFAQRKYDIIAQYHPELIPLGKNVLVKANMALVKNMWKPGAEKFRDVERQCQKTVRENARYFIPVEPIDKVVFFVIRLRVFWLFKWAYGLWKGR